MSKENVKGVLKLLTDNMHSGTLPLNIETLEILVQKHPEPREPSPDILIQEPARPTVRPTEILSKEGTTQGDPTSMEVYVLGSLPMLHSLLDFVLTNNPQTREVAFDDDLTVAGKIANIKNFWEKLATIGPKYGYFPKSTKSYLIVTKNCLKDAKTMFTDMNISTTTSGRKHLGAIVGSMEDLSSMSKTLSMIGTHSLNFYHP